MYRCEVQLMDVIETIFVMEYSFRGCGIFHDRINLCQYEFPEDPEKSHEERKQKILSILNFNANE